MSVLSGIHFLPQTLSWTLLEPGLPIPLTHKRGRVVLPVGGVPCTGDRPRSGFYLGKKSLKSSSGHLGPNLRSFYLLCKPRGDKIHGVPYTSAPLPWAAALHTRSLAATRAAVGLPRAWAPWGSRAQCLPTQAPWARWHTYACCYNWLCVKWAPGHFSPRPNQRNCPFLHNAVPRRSAHRGSLVPNADKSLGYLTLPQACFKCQWPAFRGLHHLLLHVHHLTLPKCRTEIFADHFCLSISICSIFLSYPAADWY